MIKKIIACLLALSFAAGMVSCGKTSDADTAVKDAEQTSSTVTTTTSATTAAAETADKESGGKETTTAKKKKKKKTETKKSESSDSKKKETEKPKETKAKETKPKETEAEAAKEDKSGKTFTYENDVYSLEMNDDKWLSVSDYKKLLKESASSSNGLYTAEYLDKIVGSIYLYNGENASKQTLVVISNPVFQSIMTDFKLEDIYDQLLLSVKPQLEAQGGITLLSDELVTHNGVKMMQLKAQGERNGITIDCDEYVFLKDGNLCVIAVTTNDKENGAAEFYKTLDTIKFK